jgi:hypothetical protein
LDGLPGVEVIMDDILEAETTTEEHDSRLDKVFLRLDQKQFKIK